MSTDEVKFSCEVSEGQIPDDNGNLLPYEEAWSRYSPEPKAVFKSLVDLVDYEGKVGFLLKLSTGELCCAPSVIKSGGEVILVPPPRDAFKWQLIAPAEVIGHYQQARGSSDGAWERSLFNDIVSYFKRASGLPSEDHYLLLAAWAMHTYVMEGFRYSPILCFFGDGDRGKTHTGKAIKYIAYRGILTSSVREAHLIRNASRYAATICIDVHDFWRVVGAASSADAVLDRYERGKIVSRIMRSRENPYLDMVHYEVFGPTVVITNTPSPAVFGSRCIEIINPLADRPFESEAVIESLSWNLRARLTAFRAKYLNQPLPDVPAIGSCRFADIMSPLHQMIRLANPGVEERFLKLAASLGRERLLEKAESPEGELLRAVIANKPKVAKGRLAVAEITSALNEGKDPGFRVNERTVGWRLRALGFARNRTSTGHAAIVWNEEQISRLRRAYGFKVPKPAATKPAAA
jgi:hypothetical protein